MKKLKISDEIKDKIKEEDVKQDLKRVNAGYCSKYDPNDSHYGQLGDYDSSCNWHPEV